MQTLGDRVQKINPDTLELVKVYESMNQILSENIEIKRSSLSKSINEYTVYHGFRWNFVPRNMDSSIVYIQPTKYIIIKNTGYIAKLNKEKTHIINVYLDRKTAAFQNGFNASNLDTIVKDMKLKENYYYVLYDNCLDDIKTEFINLKNNGNKILLYKNGVGQYQNKNLINEFTSKDHCCRTLKISDRTITKSIQKNIEYNGYVYSYLPAKISILSHS